MKENVTDVKAPHFLTKVNVLVRGDPVEWFQELYKKCQKDKKFEKLYLSDPMRALLVELTSDNWKHVPNEEFEKKFDGALREKGKVTIETAVFPMDAERILKMAERLYKDEAYAKSFRADVVRNYQREGGSVLSKSYCKTAVKCNSDGKCEASAECGVEW